MENGPRRRANGGFAAGTFADLVGGTATVALRRMVPLDRSFAVLETSDGLTVLEQLREEGRGMSYMQVLALAQEV